MIEAAGAGRRGWSHVGGLVLLGLLQPVGAGLAEVLTQLKQVEGLQLEKEEGVQKVGGKPLEWARLEDLMVIVWAGGMEDLKCCQL